MSERDNVDTSPDEALIRAVWKEARDLIKHLESTTVHRFSVQAGEYKIEIERGSPGAVVTTTGPVVMPAQTEAASQAVAAVTDNRFPVMAPLVGTFFGAPQPGANPFVQAGDTVDKGQTVAIVEAMKILNQVEADRPGRVLEIVVKDGEWVEFQQVLMYLEPIEE
jgi:acetyl-CoA carboxylase biotin carboxyl carrier protein